MDRPFRRCGVIGVLMIIVGGIILFLLPMKAETLMDGFVTPILAFEFVQTPNEVFGIFGSSYSTERQNLIESMTLGNYVDFLFMALYTLFLVLFFSTCARLARQPIYNVGVFFALTALIGDVCENVFLLKILFNLGSGSFSEYLSWLGLFTWVKWGSLATVALALIPFLWRVNRFTRLVAVWCVITIALGILAYINRSFANELYSWFISGLFLWLVIFSFSYQRNRRIQI